MSATKAPDGATLDDVDPSPAPPRPCDSCLGSIDPRAPSIETTCENCQSRAEDHWEDVQTRGYQ